MARLADAAAYQPLTGDYYSADGFRVSFFLKNGQFYGKSGPRESLLANVGQNTFSTLAVGPRS
ncbi:hypothetical protein GCM10022407_39010 [Hymenobacter antarcticus]|uniref:Uncharacterized protein n=2 Tax=Hymenobacter antarcticus TaxID=486270 RepID=A0ABP7R0Q6_9BACT